MSEVRLIDANALKEEVWHSSAGSREIIINLIDNAPTVEYTFTLEDMQKAADTAHGYGILEGRNERPQGEWVEFARWVAKEVLDNYFEESSGAFAEIACRKLVKLGLVEVKDNVYKRKENGNGTDN